MLPGVAPRPLAAVVTALLVFCGAACSRPVVSAPSAAQVVHSDDGSATLTIPGGALPAGLTAGAIRITRAQPDPSLQVNDSIPTALYKLEPNGTTFLKPLSLKIEGLVKAGEQPFAILLSNQSTTTSLDGTLDVGDGMTARVLSVQLPHFSDLVIGNSGLVQGSQHSLFFPQITITAPASALVGSSFPVSAVTTYGDVSYDIRHQEDAPGAPIRHHTYHYTNTILHGSFSGAGLSPAEVPNAPPDTTIEATSKFTANGTFGCKYAGPATLFYTATIRVAYTASGTDGYSADGTGTTAVSTYVNIVCTSTPTPSSPRSPSTTGSAKLPVITRIQASLAVPVTTYTVTAQDPDNPGAPLRYDWAMIGEACGTPLVPWKQSGPSVTWSHSGNPPDNCSHVSPNHAVVAFVTVTTAKGGAIQCKIEGSEDLTVDNPPCQPPP